MAPLRAKVPDGAGATRAVGCTADNTNPPGRPRQSKRDAGIAAHTSSSQPSDR